MELYVHIPFCARKCGYCDFVSAPAEETVQRAYMRALRKEICLAAEELQKAGRCGGGQEAEACAGAVTSVFFGGGTPSIVEAEEIAETLACIRREFAVAEEAEISLEANPGTLTREKSEIYRRAGINRLSIGLQSADDGELLLLGRIHTFEEFRESYGLAREAGFQNINVDLMAALPGQTLESFEKSLRAVTELSPAPEHISVYSLILEEGTPFYDKYHRQALAREAGEEDCRPLPAEAQEREMYVLTGRLLAACGYERYEISNYAKPGFACRHNTGYWTGVPYLGFGISAASFLNGSYAGAAGADGRRFSNGRDLETYLRLLEGTENGRREETPGGMVLRRLRQEEEAVTMDRAMEEFMFLGLRLTEGVSERGFERRFGTKLKAVYGNVLGAMERDGLMERTGAEGTCWRLTAQGIDVSNYVLAEFLL